jgi:hypothetical protein
VRCRISIGLMTAVGQERRIDAPATICGMSAMPPIATLIWRAAITSSARGEQSLWESTNGMVAAEWR